MIWVRPTCAFLPKGSLKSPMFLTVNSFACRYSLSNYQLIFIFMMIFYSEFSIFGPYVLLLDSYIYFHIKYYIWLENGVYIELCIIFKSDVSKAHIFPFSRRSQILLYFCNRIISIVELFITISHFSSFYNDFLFFVLNYQFLGLTSYYLILLIFT